MTGGLSTELEEFLWGDRDEPYYAAHPTPHRTAPVRKGEALELLRQGDRYFAPVPRVAVGNSREHCAPAFNALWCDIDIDPTLTKAQILDRAVDRLETMGFDFYPSAIVYSGNRGVHLYWKLDHDLPSFDIEGYNKRLAQILGGDHCFSVTQILRHPGTVHEKSNRLAEIVEFTGQVWGVRELDRLGPLPQWVERKERAPVPGYRREHEDWLEASQELGGWAERDLGLDELVENLPVLQHRYMLDQPRRGWSRWGYPSRSEIECDIVYRLVGRMAGASDRQIRELADQCFAKHIDEYPTRGDQYIDRTITAARRQHYVEGWITSPLGGMPRKRDAKYRHANAEDEEAFLSICDGRPLSEWVKEVQECGFSRATAYRIKDRLVKTGRLHVSDANRVFAVQADDEDHREAAATQAFDTDSDIDP